MEGPEERFWSVPQCHGQGIQDCRLSAEGKNGPSGYSPSVNLTTAMAASSGQEKTIKLIALLNLQELLEQSPDRGMCLEGDDWWDLMQHSGLKLHQKPQHTF